MAEWVRGGKEGGREGGQEEMGMEVGPLNFSTFCSGIHFIKQFLNVTLCSCQDASTVIRGPQSILFPW